ncbi:uncharacterized protein ATC70_000030 [Mucor velutinosus]|uniref:Uncharacterized protein n=1 Tax=Mucor velutinosus TaxID=708070 RepID=A0AAN7HXA2_9FUNG|nr:hypothetical protein ATC70_000030 [Mucor velutinosus]
MTTDQLTILIQSLQEQIKQGQDVENELRHDIDNQSRQQKALSNENDYLKQKLAAIQLDNSNYGNTQARLETQLYAQEQDISKLRKDIQQLTKAKKDVEKKLSSELQDYENDKSIWQQREADLYNQIRSLSINNLGEPRTPRTPRRRSVTANTLGIMSPFTSGLGDIGENQAGANTNDRDATASTVDERPTPKLAVIDSSYARETKIAQRTIKAQDKMIFDLKNEVEKLKSVIQEQQNESQTQSLHASHLQHEIVSIKEVNRGLMEENESYQILLHEKTINGEFMMNPIMQVEDNPAMKESISTSSNNQGLNLAAELASSIPDWNNQKESESDQTIQKLNEEIKTLQDTNRALQLYMNKILMKIINNKQLEDVLSIDQPSKSSHHPSSNAEGNKSSAAGAGSAADTSGRGGPTPTKTVSTVAPASSGTASKSPSPSNRQRRRTISYWGSKAAPPPPPSKSASQQDMEGLTATREEKRRHSSIVQNAPPQPERSMSTTTSSSSGSANGGWAKALRRMSGIGWTSVKEEPTSTVAVNNDSAVGSLSEDENAEMTSRKSSGSSTPSIRRSNELGTLSEE